MSDAVAFKCKYCQKYYTNKKEFAQHKKDEHADHMSTTASSVSSMPSTSAVRSPPSRPRGTTAASPGRRTTRGGPSTSTPQFVKPGPRSKKRPVPVAQPPVEEPADEETEEIASAPSTPPPSSPSRRPGPKSKKRTSKNPMPVPIGKKKKVVKDGLEQQEWIRNPKFNGA